MASMLHSYFPLKEKQSQMPDYKSEILNSAPRPAASHHSLSLPTKTRFTVQSLHESLCENGSKCNNSRQPQLSKCLLISHLNG